MTVSRWEGEEGSGGSVFVRPLLVLAAGLAVAGAIWWVLNEEPGRRPVRLGRDDGLAHAGGPGVLAVAAGCSQSTASWTSEWYP